MTEALVFNPDKNLWFSKINALRKKPDDPKEVLTRRRELYNTLLWKVPSISTGEYQIPIEEQQPIIVTFFDWMIDDDIRGPGMPSMAIIIKYLPEFAIISYDSAVMAKKTDELLQATRDINVNPMSLNHCRDMGRNMTLEEIDASINLVNILKTLKPTN